MRIMKLNVGQMVSLLMVLVLVLAGPVGAPVSMLGQSIPLTTPNSSTTINYGSAAATTPLKVGSANPASCVQGEMFFNTSQPAGKNVYLCTATNTWTLQAGLGAYSQSFTSQTSVALTHNLGTTDVGVWCYDAGSPPSQVGWNTLQLTNSNTVTVTFSVSQSGKCVVIHGGNGGGGGSSVGAFQDLTDGKVTKDSSTQVTVAVGKTIKNGAVTDTPATAQTLTSPTATTGNAWIGINIASTPTLTAWHNLTSVTNSGGGVTLVGSSSGFPTDDVIPLATCTVSSNAWGTCTDHRGAFNGRVYGAAGGLIKNGGNFEAGPTIPIFGSSTTVPGSCTSYGQLYFDTDASSGGKLYYCNGATYEQVAGSGTGMADPGGNGFVDRTALNTTAARTLTGTANEIGVTNGGGGGNPVFSIAATFDISGKTSTKPVKTGTTAPGTCSVGELFYDTDATAGQNLFGCTATNTWTQLGGSGGGLGDPGADGVVVRSGLNTTINRTITGTSNEVDVTNGNGVSGNPTLALAATLNLTSKTVRIPNSTTLPGTCSVGDIYMDTDATSGQRLYLCQATNTWAVQGDGAGSFTANQLLYGTGSGVTSAGGFTVDTTNIRIKAAGASGSIQSGFDADNSNTAGASAGYRILHGGSLAGAFIHDRDSTELRIICSPNYASATPCMRIAVGGSQKGMSIGYNPQTPIANAIGFSTIGSETLRVIIQAGTSNSTTPMFELRDDNATLGNGTLRFAMQKDGTITGSAIWPVANGGTGAGTLTGLVKGNGTSAFTAAVAGTDYSSPSSSDTLTNKILNAESTGNTLTIPMWLPMPLVGCASTTGTLMWDTLASNPPTATCSAGSTNTNMIRGVADFPDSDGDYSIQMQVPLPPDFTGTVDAYIKWRAAATSGDVVWQIQTACVADGEVDDVAWNTASTVTDTAKGTTNQSNDALITGVTITGCAAQESLHLRALRNRTHASDSITGVVSLMSIGLMVRRAI